MFYTTRSTASKLPLTNILYAACKAILHTSDAEVVADTHRTQPRLVAFWCSWDNKVKAGFGATNIERDAITDYRL